MSFPLSVTGRQWFSLFIRQKTHRLRPASYSHIFRQFSFTTLIRLHQLHIRPGLFGDFLRTLSLAHPLVLSHLKHDKQRPPVQCMWTPNNNNATNQNPWAILENFQSQLVLASHWPEFLSPLSPTSLHDRSSSHITFVFLFFFFAVWNIVDWIIPIVTGDTPLQLLMFQAFQRKLQRPSQHSNWYYSSCCS